MKDKRKAIYNSQKHAARHRSIGWLLSFDEWWSLWESSGKWPMRGRGKGKYVMARRGDVGPYSTDNVYFTTLEGNLAESAFVNGERNKRKSHIGALQHVISTARGWTFRSGLPKPYQVTFRKRYIGSYATQIEADDAYASVLDAHVDHVLRMPAS